MVKVYRPRRRGLRRRLRRKGAKRVTLNRLVRSVKRLQRTNKVNTKWDQLTKILNLNVESDYYAYNLDMFSSMIPRFGMTVADGDQNTIINYSDVLRINVDLANGILTETGKINFHCFLVTLRDEIGSAFNPATGAITLVNGTHYYSAGQGLFVLNPKVFKVHASKRFILDNHGVALATSTGQTQYGTQMAFDMYLKRNQQVKTTGRDWISSVCPPDPSKNSFFIVFNDNSALDAEYPALNLLQKKTVKSM